MRNHDVVIIGGSLAGAACVRTLTAAGIDAVAFERDAFPREKVCGGFLSPGSVEALEELSVLDEVREAGAVPVNGAHVHCAGAEMQMEFRRPGLGVSRRKLDAVLARHPAIERANVSEVRREGDGRFRIQLDGGTEVGARVVVDAAGKLGHFGAMKPVQEFGVQYEESNRCSNTMQFWFFADGYGGSVGIEEGRANSCFLIRREALPRYIRRDGVRVTGPMMYRARRSDYLTIGDAAGMIDPFCGEGMHHALDTGRIAAKAVIAGLEEGWSYDRICARYERERQQRWSRKRAMARAARVALQFPALRRVGFGMNLRMALDWFWAL